MTYLDRLQRTVNARGMLCVGLDPSPNTLAGWGLDDDAAGAERLCREVVAAVGDRVAVFKPQSGFFEAYGPEGVAALARVLGDIREAGAISILDVKRGDIGSTMTGYARAYLAPDAPLAADAITLSPFLGFGSLEPAFRLADEYERGCYVLCQTSNPEGSSVQLAATDRRSVAQSIVDAANARNAEVGTGSVGLVIGATLNALGVDLTGFTGSILAPGIGAQGGTIEHLADVFGPIRDRVLPTASRSVLSAGPRAEGLRRAVADLKREAEFTR